MMLLRCGTDVLEDETSDGRADETRRGRGRGRWLAADLNLKHAKREFQTKRGTNVRARACAKWASLFLPPPLVQRPRASFSFCASEPLSRWPPVVGLRCTSSLARASAL